MVVLRAEVLGKSSLRAGFLPEGVLPTLSAAAYSIFGTFSWKSLLLLECEWLSI